jgi:hypothetical protein
MDKKYDILFYGGMNSRRHLILSELSKLFTVKVVTNTFGQALTELIKQSKVVLNLHYYRQPLLETARLHEALPYDLRIVSEKPCDEDKATAGPYRDLVTFVEPVAFDMSNLEPLCQTLRTVLDSFDKTHSGGGDGGWNKRKLSIEKLREKIRTQTRKVLDNFFFF